MANYSFVAPLLPGGEERMRDWIKRGINNNADHDRLMREFGISREQGWIQRTPMGNFAVITFDVKDPQRAFEMLARSKDPWAVQFKDFLKQAHGIDVTQPVPLNEQVIDWGVTERTSAYNK